jgi:hypothetical protein
MTEQEILQLDKLENDDQLDQAIKYINVRLGKNDLDSGDMIKLTDLVYEYEDRTDVLNRDFRI